MLQPDEPD